MWPGALLARRTRTMKQCSSDARSQGQPRPLPFVEGWDNGENGGCCSPVLVQRAVSEDPRWTRAVGDQSAPIPERERASLEGALVLRFTLNPVYDGILPVRRVDTNCQRVVACPDFFSSLKPWNARASYYVSLNR